MATFEMTIVANNLHGDYQLANGYGPDKAKSVFEVSSKSIALSFPPSLQCTVFISLYFIAHAYNLQEHRRNFVSGSDFSFISQNGINAVRIPVGWWIAYDPDPPAPFIGGSLNALDRAFHWAQ